MATRFLFTATLLLAGCTERTCVSHVNPTEPGVASAFLEPFEGTVQTTSALPEFYVVVDTSTVESMVVAHSCPMPDRTFAYADAAFTDAHSGTGEGEVSTLSIEVGEVGAWFRWTPSPADVAWITAEAEAAVGPLGEFVEVYVGWDWSSGELSISPHFVDDTQEGGTLQLGPADVASFGTTFTFTH